MATKAHTKRQSGCKQNGMASKHDEAGAKRVRREGKAWAETSNGQDTDQRATRGKTELYAGTVPQSVSGQVLPRGESKVLDARRSGAG